ncbi:M1 family metallopeptidase [Neolewinella persica]|uniref:M1 family metallopeptidase n=1 Tax=Neolewinella persica TaxID=70998 RepID=UPI0003646430|nr:M1 family metallopeptidase [Neolewinella persica]
MRFFLLLLSLCLSCSLAAQPAYFQQDVSYDIEARLNDETNELHAHLKLTYTNNSPDTLVNIGFHLWPRAYASDNTAFAKQMLRNGSTRFHFSDHKFRGTLDSLSFIVGGEQAEHRFDTDNPDIAWVYFTATPLLPGKTMTIETPFRVKIPASFSRLGHVGDSYQMTQWYPKPAVYDRKGWHVMPYLDQGEFYSEFGTFRVKLTLPANYVVGATGTLQEPEERRWLLEKSANDRQDLVRRAAAEDLSENYVAEPYPPSATAFKTITYTAEQVHDFAWFADKRFKVLHDTLQLSGQPEATDVWSMFTETEAALWVNSTDYIKRATRFYSEQVGTYPYPQVTGLQSALSAGGGMEYPMITVIGQSGNAADLDDVLAHEVGHNWFYGILGSNERDHPWMDEGLNTFYEQRYMAKFWPKRPKGIELLGRQIDYNRLGYHYTARLGKDQAPDTRSDSLSPINYGIGAYSKPAMALQELEAYVGTARLDAAMQAYFDGWKFRHPQPEDFFAAMEAGLGMSLRPWFPDAFLTTKTSDWAIKGKANAATGQLPLVHKGSRPAPATAHLKTSDGKDMTSSIDPQASAISAPEDLESLTLGTAENPLDLWTSNNRQGNKPLKVSLVIDQEQSDVRQIFALPLVGFNEHDGGMLGGALHNRTLEPQRLEWMLAPMFGTRSSRLTGFAGVKWRSPSSAGKVAQVTTSLGVQRFSDFTLRRTNVPYDYVRTAALLEYTFRHAPISQVESGLLAQVINLSRTRPDFNELGEVSGEQRTNDLFLRATYHRAVRQELSPIAWSTTLEYKNTGSQSAFNTNHLRLEAELTGGHQYERNRFLRWRAFGGVFLANELRDRATRSASGFSLVDNAFSDYRYDDLYVGRNLGGRNEQQLGRRQGGFRAPISSAFSFGTSNNYLLAANVDADLPGMPDYLPLCLFLDAGYYGFRSVSSEPERGEFSWVGGAGLSLAKGRMGIYVPLIADPTTKQLLEQRGNLLDRLTVRLNLSGWLPWKWVDDLF